jgi:hypothetical protein
VVLSSHRSWREWSKALIAPGIALIIFSPWLLVNTVYTGNPLFPQVWPTEWTSQERLAYFERPGESAGFQVLWMPLAATWYGLETSRVEGMVSWFGSGSTSSFTGGSADRWSRSSTIKVLTIWLLGGWLGMAIGGKLSPLLWQTRLYWVLLPAGMAVGFGWTLDGIQAFNIRLGRILAAGIILVCALSLGQDLQAAVVHKPLDVILGVNTPDDYLKTRLGWLMPAMLALRKLPEETRTLFLWEPRGYYSPLSSLPDVWIDRWYLARREINSPAAILDEWKQAGFTHLLVYRDGADFERADRPELSYEDWQAFVGLSGWNWRMTLGKLPALFVTAMNARLYVLLYLYLCWFFWQCLCSGQRVTWMPNIIIQWIAPRPGQGFQSHSWNYLDDPQSLSPSIYLLDAVKLLIGSCWDGIEWLDQFLWG